MTARAPMSQSWSRLALTAVLVGSLMGAPLRAQAEPARKLSAEQVLAVEAPGAQRAWTRLHIARDSNELRAKASEVLNKAGAKSAGLIGSSLLNDVFQAAVIMLASAVAQLTHDRMERDRLAAGYTPAYQDIKREAVRAAGDLLCGTGAGSAGVTSEVLCSGEFWMATAGGLATRIGVEVTVMQMIKALLRTTPTRAALIELVGTTAASFLMLAGFQMSAYLWTQAVHILNDPAKEEQAHKIFGRAVEMWASGRWADYARTEDGRIAAQVFENMRNILLVDPVQRSAWFYNAWRFGLARGELIVTLGVLMAALSAGSAAGTAVAAAVGLPASATAFVVASCFGAAMSALIVYAPDLHVGEELTRLIQGIRSWMADTRHSMTRNQIRNSAQAFNINRFQLPVMARYKQRYEQQLRGLLPVLAQRRMSWTGIAFEKYQELRDKVDESERTLALAEAVVKNSKLRKNLILQDGGGKLMTYDQARQKFCAPPQVDPFTGVTYASPCDFPLAYQLQKISEARRAIQSGEQTLSEIAGEILQMYSDDAASFQNLLDDVQLQFPSDIALNLKNQSEDTALLGQALAWNFASLHAGLRDQLGLSFDSDDEINTMAATARAFIQDTYLNGFDENAYLQRLKNFTDQGG
jgi:hypothetical protein